MKIGTDLFVHFTPGRSCSELLQAGLAFPEQAGDFLSDDLYLCITAVGVIEVGQHSSAVKLPQIIHALLDSEHLGAYLLLEVHISGSHGGGQV